MGCLLGKLQVFRFVVLWEKSATRSWVLWWGKITSTQLCFWGFLKLLWYNLILWSIISIFTRTQWTNYFKNFKTVLILVFRSQTKQILTYCFNVFIIKCSQRGNNFPRTYLSSPQVETRTPKCSPWLAFSSRGGTPPSAGRLLQATSPRMNCPTATAANPNFSLKPFPGPLAQPFGRQVPLYQPPKTSCSLV